MGFISSSLATISSLTAIALTCAQNTISIPPTPEELALQKLYDKALARADVAKEQNKLDEAISSYREAITIEAKRGGFSSTANYRLAKTYELAGRKKEALLAYKQALKWNARASELDVSGPQHILVTMDYAILLSKCDRLDEAKAVYYSGLRRFNANEELDFEPIPFLVVFDPDPKMEVWELTRENLITAALMAKAQNMSWDAKKSIDEVLRRDSSLVFAQILKAMHANNEDGKALISYAEGLAKTERERQWIRDFRDGKNLAPVGAELRKNSQALYQAKNDLEKIHKKIAS